MKRIHLLRIEPGMDPSLWEPLLAAVHSDGGRAGRLRWHPGRPSEDEALALASGFLRSVEVATNGALVRKPRTGPPVLTDILREHFRGCRVVLVEGEASEGLAAIPRLEPTANGFRLDLDGAQLALSAIELANRLRRPRLF
ncbi:MAG: hypothetical protein MPN21_14090 [Thermoanaerobaculia bacterium]|nr:hypothetical protein [Thermoanaerobaculia bacterium]